jgi:peptidoglycan/LPS O-acetylase OafA/YrhL
VTIPNFPAEVVSVGQALRKSFRRDIQGLRALAVLLVIGNHAGLPGFAGGYIGVDMFFVVSGFVITGLLLRDADRGLGSALADFYCRRIRRIAPAATVTLVGTLVIGVIVAGPRLDPSLPSDVRWASLFAGNFRLISAGSNYFVPGIHPSLVTQFWSLAVEEQFYIAFPLVVFLIARLVSPVRRLQVLSATLVPMIMLSAWWSFHISYQEPVTAYYSPFTRFWELGLGCLLATVMTLRPERTMAAERLAGGLAVALLAVALFTLNSASVYPGVQAWLPCVATGLLIWAGGSVGARTSVTRVLSTRLLGYVGDISFSLYLTHYMWIELPKQLPFPPAGWDWRLLELGATALSSVCLYHLVENPTRRSHRLGSDRMSIVLLLGVCVAASWTTAAIVSRYLPAS